jgi:hypothetical protein
MDEIDDEFEELPITYSIDNAILMHRDAHFAGSFPIMLEYYRKEGRGCFHEFEIARIEDLAQTEMLSGKNLSSTLLSGAEAEKIGRSRERYKSLRAVYENPDPKKIHPKLIADLILAEDEDLDKAIDAIVEEKSSIVPALIELMHDEDLHDNLFPGYGQAALLAARCLGKIGDKRALIALYEPIGEENLFDEDILLEALYNIGEPAKNFLLKILHAKPLTYDNERAAVALIKFKDDQEIATAALKMLQELDLKKHPILANYLALICAGLTDAQDREALLTLAKKDNTPNSLRLDIGIIAKEWKNRDSRVK